MRAFLLVGLIFSAFLLFLGFTSRKTAGDVLSATVIICGVLVFLFVAIIWIFSYIKEKKEREM
jgi:amino acid transporter